MGIKAKKQLRYLDLFAGAGGLSEGFIREGYIPVAHVEMNEAACNTLKTRAAFHYLLRSNNIDLYKEYISGSISRDSFYSHIPKKILDSVICEEIGDNTIKGLFSAIDKKLNGKRIDLIIGGPPCQAYSLVGRARDPHRMEGDKRNYLFQYYAQFLKKYQPKYFIFENVLGLLSAKDFFGKRYFDTMREKFAEHGYKMQYKILSANNYGVLQHRRRIILIGEKTDKEFVFPDLEEWHPQATVFDLLSDLPAIPSGGGNVYSCNLKTDHSKWLDDACIYSKDFPVTFHCARPNSKIDLEIYYLAVLEWNKYHRRLQYDKLPRRLQKHQNKESFLDRFKVVAGDEPASQTVVAHIAKDGHYYIHPKIEQNRSITPREAARLQTFPDDYFFESVSGKPSRTEAYKQIGNAVPVLLAQKIAAKLKEVWDE